MSDSLVLELLRAIRGDIAVLRAEQADFKQLRRLEQTPGVTEPTSTDRSAERE